MDLDEALKPKKEAQTQENKTQETNETQENNAQTTQTNEQQTQTTENNNTEKTVELSEEVVLDYLEKNNDQSLKFLSKKLGRDINSFEDLIETKEVVKEVEAEMPESLKKVKDFMNETGRGLDDFLKANKDWSGESDDNVVMEYIQQSMGYSKEEAKEYINMRFKPKQKSVESDEEFEERKRMADFEFKTQYRQGLKFLEDQKSKYSIPSETISQQREALRKQEENDRRFSEEMTKALESYNEFQFDDVSFKVDKSPDMSKKFTSLDGILSQYKTKDGFNYKGLLADLHRGQNFEQFARHYSNEKHNKYIEKEMSELENRKTQTRTIDEIAKTDGSRDGARKVLGL